MSLGIEMGATNGGELGTNLDKAEGWTKGNANGDELEAKLGKAKVWAEGCTLDIEMSAANGGELGGKLGKARSCAERCVMGIVSGALPMVTSWRISWARSRARRRLYTCKDSWHDERFEG